MKYFKEISSDIFYKSPCTFDKYTDKEKLKYSLGAILYIPSTKSNLADTIMFKLKNTASIILCFEDAIKDEDIEKGEMNVIDAFKKINKCLNENMVSSDDLPLIFLRVKNETQFISISSKLSNDDFKLISGFAFPKFTSKNAKRYLSLLEVLRNKYSEVLYALPILETEGVLYKEKRLSELKELKNIISHYDSVLGIMVGSTDLSSLFGIRRPMHYSIYDIHPINDCLCDILNFFNRQYEEYSLIGSVWEYFSNTELPQNANITYDSIVLSPSPIISAPIDGLIKETLKDKYNGFSGKGSIHPSQVDYINASYTVTYEEYMDAVELFDNKFGGVFKGIGGFKMNEPKTHFNWARKILTQAEIFGVLNENVDKIQLIKKAGS